jgi:hypothetical protein
VQNAKERLEIEEKARIESFYWEWQSKYPHRLVFWD